MEEAVATLEEHSGEAYIRAGGTALTLLIRQGLLEPGVIVDLGGVAGSRSVRESADGGLYLGALMTLRQLELDALLRARAPILAETLRQVATVRVRNQATLGGNLAHADPAQDPPPTLMALESSLEVVGPDGPRSISLDDFFVDVFETALGPADIVTGVSIPAQPPGYRIHYEKFLPRTVDDYATVSIAGRLVLDENDTVTDARIILGAVGPTPLRAQAVERMLLGANTTELDFEGLASAARDASDPVDDARGSADYKREMTGVMVGRTVRRLVGTLGAPE